MAIIISGNGIDMGQNAISNASQVEVQEQQVSPFSGFKNFIINGNFDIWQRGTSGVSFSSPVGPDMWRVWANAANTNWSQAISSDFGIYASNIELGLKWYGDPSSIQDPIEHRIESINAIRLSNKYVTVSFIAKSSIPQTVSIELVKPDSKDNYTTTTAISSSSIQVTTTAIKFSVTLLVNDVKNGLSLIVRPSVKNQFMYIAQVQLEIGSIATPFENRPYGLELSLCQRYYEVSGQIATNLIAASISFQGGIVPWTYKVTKRISPTVEFIFNNGTKTAMTQYNGVQGCAFVPSVQATNVTDYIGLVATSSAEL